MCLVVENADVVVQQVFPDPTCSLIFPSISGSSSPWYDKSCLPFLTYQQQVSIGYHTDS